MNAEASAPLTDGELLQLKRWNTPTVYNGWEQITRHDAGRDCFNLEEARDFMPHMGPMVGYAVTVTFQPGNPEHARRNPNAWLDYYRHVAGVPGPKIVVVQDLDKPRTVGAFFGEVTGNTHRALGCVGAIVDGAIRDLDEMNSAGFKALARRLCVGHAYSSPVRWGCEVEVFGRRVHPGQLIHADKHGFLVVPFGEERRLLEAAVFMDQNECNTLIAAAKGLAGLTREQMLQRIEQGVADFRKAVEEKFGRRAE